MLKMRCRAPFCKNASDDVSTESKGISFHAFPSEVGLRTAWLRALGKQDSLLPDSAVVCSQHFLDDDICATGSGLRQLAPGAVPSTVQVCMICLDTDSRLFLMSKHKMEEAYEKLTGYPPCDVGNLKQALCIQCAQRLRTFSRFRDKSLRARAIMMDLVEKHEFITRRHIKMISRTKNHLDNSFVMTTLGPDPCDLHIQEHTSEEQQTGSEATLQTVEVKKEDGYDSIDEDMAVDDDMVGENDDSNAECVNDELVPSNEECFKETKDPLKYESALFQCTLCCEEFESGPVYEQHMALHSQAGAGDGEPAIPKVQSTDLDPPAVAPFRATNKGNKVQAAEVDTVERSRQVFVINNGKLDKQSFDANSITKINRLTNCVVKLYDVFEKPKQCVPIQDGSLVTQRALGRCSSKRHIDTASRVLNCQVASQNEDIGPVMNKVNLNNRPLPETLQNELCSRTFQVILPRKTKLPNNDINERSTLIGNNKITCGVSRKMCEGKRHLLKHVKSHTKQKPFTCNFCEKKFQHKSVLVTHLRTHTGEKPYSCLVCKYKCALKNSLVKHLKTHTGEKPYSCDFCTYKAAEKIALVRHIRTHTGEKPFSCELCKYKFKQNYALVRHMKTHTGEKPYSCELCKYKCKQSSNLVNHMRTHTGEKPYSCELCKYKCKQSSHLVSHMKTHTGEKSYSCQLCKYKCARSSCLVMHMKTHTGENPCRRLTAKTS